MKSISFYGNTDLGKMRDNNEDAFVVQSIWDDNHLLAVVIDGVGGNEGGEVAAEIAKESIINYLLKYPNGERMELLKQAVVFANNMVLEERSKQPQYANMSCVLTAVLIEIDKRRINMAHVGDTRLYQYASDSFVKLSHDHSMVGYREEIGDLTEQEAMNHPQRNIISKDVGSEQLDNNTDYIEVAVMDLKKHSSLLLCSDGLCDMITSSQMREILNEDIAVNEKVDKLITAANDAGGRDNVTVVLIECAIDDDDIETHDENIEEDIEDKEAAEETEKNKKCNAKIIIPFILTAVMFFMAGFFVGDYWGNDIISKTFHHTAVADTNDAMDSIVCDTINYNTLDK